MYSFLISAGAGIGTYALLRFPLDLHWGIALGVGVLVTLLTYLGITYLVNKQLEKRLPAVEQALMNQSPEIAIRLLEEAQSLKKWSYPIGLAIDGQLGVIHYAHKQDMDTAEPYLEKAFVKNWQAKAMLGALYARRKQYDRMEEVFEKAVKSNKDESLLYAAWAWCENKRGNREKAIEILEDAKERMEDHEGIRQNLSALHQGKRMKMKAWEPEWWALHLQRPPARVVTGGRKVQGRYIKRG